LTRAFILQNLVTDTTGTNAFKWRINIPVLEKYLDSIVGEHELTRKFYGPTLFVGGKQAPYVRDDEAHRADIQAFFPNSTIKMMESGHNIHAEKPNEFAALVTNFFSYG